MTCAAVDPLPPPLSAPSRVSAVSAAAAAALLRPRPRRVAVVDARPPALFLLEHVPGAVAHPPSHVPSRLILVYDTGTPALPHPLRPTTPALRMLLALRRCFPTAHQLVLVEGGLPALAAEDPRLLQCADATALDALADRLKNRCAPTVAVRAVRHLSAALDPPGRVLPWLLLGSLPFANHSFVTASRVTHVLSLCEKPPALRSVSHHLVVRMRDCSQYRAHMHFEHIVAFLTHVKASHGVVLVHCTAGVSRSAFIVLVYLMWLGYDRSDAWTLVRDARRCACPNDGFWQQLSEWQLQLAHMRSYSACMHSFKTRVLSIRQRGFDAAHSVVESAQDAHHARATASSFTCCDYAPRVL
ncbi:Dual specificity protein phosphatase 19 [Gracilariopsis chorda]|uniref:Dual specificity protein phosphatase 19 n=1 Tax=Gracilariopsis chorda TaxID=448386 RepID=A0A2V3IZ76_9FLOR|nr:Dual specificity protein phosphatase 19 [Gracilariopsis chorda]|eukprot:PXF47448.1 Dual specificity protein phosphatase 19 [Gracilariopsis chorda]